MSAEDNRVCVCVCVVGRFYLQFSLDHIHILSPSAAMVTHLHQRGQESGDDVPGRSNKVLEEEMDGGDRRRRQEEEPSSSLSAPDSVRGRPCVSIVIKVELKEGVALRNTGVGLKCGGAGLLTCFSVRAVVIGPVVIWGWDPKNSPMTERETEMEEGRVRQLNIPLNLTSQHAPVSVLHLCAGGPVVLWCDSSLVPHPPARIFLQTCCC